MWLLMLACAQTVEAPQGPVSPPADPDPLQGLVVHLSMDDLPWQIQQGQQPTLSLDETAAWNRRIRDHLAAYEVQASVFFVCDWLQEGSTEVQAWAAGGHAIGNHTAHHLAARKVGPEAFLADAAACQERLAAQGHPARWFRFPYLSHGADTAAQEQIRQGLTELGLTNLPIAAPTTEWVFAFRYRMALEAQDHAEARRLGAAYLEHMDAALLHAELLARQTTGQTAPHTVLVHANELNGDWLDDLLQRWQERGVRFVGAEVAMAHGMYQRPIIRTSSGALPWALRVTEGELTPELGWFGEEEAQISAEWPLPPEPWPTGVPVSAALPE